MEDNAFSDAPASFLEFWYRTNGAIVFASSAAEDLVLSVTPLVYSEGLCYAGTLNNKSEEFGHPIRVGALLRHCHFV
jgi:hypothetical protein